MQEKTNKQNTPKRPATKYVHLYNIGYIIMCIVIALTIIMMLWRSTQMDAPAAQRIPGKHY